MQSADTHFNNLSCVKKKRMQGEIWITGIVIDSSCDLGKHGRCAEGV
jgi:hypothetical protein